MMKLRFARPDLIVDLRRLSPQLRYVREDGDWLAIGALTTHADIEFDPLLERLVPFMPRAAKSIADPLVRSCGTFGGSLAHVDPFGDWPAVALALEAEVHVLGAEGMRTVAIEGLIAGPYTTTLEAAEIVTEVRFHPLVGRSAGAYLKHTRSGESDFAVLGCCAVLRGTDGVIVHGRVAFTGLAAAPHRDHAVEEALRGSPLDEKTIAGAAARAGEGAKPLDDANASPEFRRHLARVLCARTLRAAAAQLRTAD